MFSKSIFALFAIIAFLIAVECKPTNTLSLQSDIEESVKKLETAVDVSIERNLNRLAESRQEFDIVMSGNLKNAFKQMIDTVHISQNRLHQMEAAATEDVSECTEGVSETISRIPIIPTKDMFLCMGNDEKQVIEIYEVGQKDVKKSKQLVEDIKEEVTNCGNNDCLTEVLIKIQTQTKEFPIIITVKANGFAKEIESLQSNMIICTSDAIHLVQDKIWALERNAEKCIEELLYSN